MKGQRLRLGIIGLGGMGMNHFRNALTVPEVQLTAVCDTDTARTAPVAAEHGVQPFSRYEELLSSGLVDAVLVAAEGDGGQGRIGATPGPQTLG